MKSEAMYKPTISKTVTSGTDNESSINQTQNINTKEKMADSSIKSIISNIKIDKLIFMVSCNLVMLLGFLTFPYKKHYKTLLWAIFVGIYSSIGITGGAHRYWTHRSFKANFPLRLIMACCYFTTFQMPLKKWVRYHRVHHKYTETEADPHNSNYGFVFAHMGWMVIKKHPDVNEKMKQMDMSDVKADAIVAFMDKHYTIVVLSLSLLTILVPVYFWNESVYYSTLSQFTRLMWVVHVSCCVNSFAHLWGYKPYDRKISPTDNNFVAYVTYGEGWHNYHHTFPYDYRMSEFSGFIKFDPTALVIKFFEKIGWAYDLKTASDSLIRKTVEIQGDASLITPY